MEHTTTSLTGVPPFESDYANRNWKFLFEPKTGYVFLLLWAFYAVIVFIQQEFIFTDEVYYNSLGEQMAYERIDTLLDVREKWGWISYLLIPVTLLFQVFFVTVCLNVGTLLAENHGIRSTGFKSLFSLVLKASVVYALYPLVLLLLALTFNQVEVMEDYQRLDFFSLAAWLGLSDNSAWWMVPLRAIHLFEILFWIV